MNLRRLVMSLVIVGALAGGAAAQPAPRQEPQDEFVPISELPPQDQLPAAPLLIAAYAFAWLAIGGYVVSVARRLNTVQQELARLEMDTKRGR